MKKLASIILHTSYFIEGALLRDLATLGASPAELEAAPVPADRVAEAGEVLEVGKHLTATKAHELVEAGAAAYVAGDPDPAAAPAAPAAASPPPAGKVRSV